MSEEMFNEYGFWRLVTEKSISITELDTWTLEDIDKANAMLDMASDWQSAYMEMLDHKSKERTEP
jgi:hypothetical protein